MASEEHYDALETRSPDERESALLGALPDQLTHARASAPAYAALLADVDCASVSSREALAALPITRKAELLERQADDPPFGGFAAAALGEVPRVFASPGPIFEPEGRSADFWRLARALFAAGFRPGELVHNAFAYHFTPAGRIFESAAVALGCTVFPAGTGQTELQVETIARLRPQGYAGTPSFLRILLDKAGEMDVDVSSMARALVSGEALPPSLRAQLGEGGVEVKQCYATADIGLIAYESPALEGMILDEGILVEIVRPGTGDPVAEGEVGEVVVTTFDPDYPLVRFATGDLSAVLPGASPCGRTNTRIKGWMGRADQTTKVRGMFVHPGQIAEVVRRHPEIGRARLVVGSVDNRDTMTLRCESARPPAGLAEAVADSIREVCKLRGAAEIVAPGELPNDGKVIEDARSYE